MHRALGNKGHCFRSLVFSFVLWLGFLFFEERDFNAHVGKNEIVFFQVWNADADFDGGLLPIGRRDNRADSCGKRPVRVSVKSRSNFLFRFDARDIGFVDVDFDLVRMHIDDRGNAGTSETASGRDGRDHLADLSILGDHDTRKRCADGAIVHGLLGFADACFGAEYLLFCKRDLGTQAVGRGADVVQSFLSLHAGGLELLRALQVDFRVAELDFVVGNGGLAGIAVGLDGLEDAPGVCVIERGEQLALGDARAFIEKNAGDAAGDFGGDGGAAARRDVAAGVEQGLRAGSVGF